MGAKSFGAVRLPNRQTDQRDWQNLWRQYITIIMIMLFKISAVFWGGVCGNLCFKTCVPQVTKERRKKKRKKEKPKQRKEEIRKMHED